MQVPRQSGISGPSLQIQNLLNGHSHCVFEVRSRNFLFCRMGGIFQKNTMKFHRKFPRIFHVFFMYFSCEQRELEVPLRDNNRQARMHTHRTSTSTALHPRPLAASITTLTPTATLLVFCSHAWHDSTAIETTQYSNAMAVVK